MGELVDLLALLVLLAAGAGYGIWWVNRRAGRLAGDRDSLRWRAGHYSREGVTSIVVELRGEGSRTARETRTVEQISDADADYDAKLVSAMISARARAGLLNSQDSLG